MFIHGVIYLPFVGFMDIYAVMHLTSAFIIFPVVTFVHWELFASFMLVDVFLVINNINIMLPAVLYLYYVSCLSVHHLSVRLSHMGA